MGQEDLRRLKVVEAVLEKRIRQRKAGEVLELSDRQVRRIAKRVRSEGSCGVLHRGRGRKSNRSHSEKFRQRVLGLYRRRYEGFGPSLAQEKLLEREGIKIGRETLRQLLMGERLWEGKRKSREHRVWRERRECLGEMVQMDGSHHDWLEGRGGKLVLMGYIDDATGRAFGRFYEYEGTLPALDSFYHYAKRYGLPQSLYLDKHSTYKGWAKLSLEEQLAGCEERPTEFGRAMADLGVKLIHAHSPQAKGRVERLFGTFQDRLIKEMRLEGIKSLEEANRFLGKYLPVYNRRFERKAKSEADLHRPAPGHLKRMVSIQTRHVLRQDNTIRHANRFYQILKRWTGHRPAEVTVQEGMDGRFRIVSEGGQLCWREIQEPPRKNPVIRRDPSEARRVHRPGLEHPYKRRSFEHYASRLKARTGSLTKTGHF